jgi:hypothetical protein
MKIRKSVALTIRLVILAMLAAALLVMSHPSWRCLASDILLWQENATASLSDANIATTAVHEAGHIVVSAALRGADSLAGVAVYTNAMFDGKETLYGHALIDKSVSPHSRRDALIVASVLYAGTSAESAVLGRILNIDTSDNQSAEIVIVGYRCDTVPDDAYAATTEAMASEESSDAMRTDMVEARRCADAAAKTNTDIIRALADEILRQPVRFSRHFMDADDLAAFFTKHPATRPSPECVFDTQAP